MQIGVLGPLEVTDDAGARVEIAGARLRALLITLALAAGRPVSVEALVDAVWGDQRPAEATNALQTLVSRLRRLLGTSAVSATPGGYRLSVSAADVDAVHFTELAARGSRALTAGDHAQAAELLHRALGLWRGPALADCGAVPGGALAQDADRLAERHLAAATDRLAADLELGRASAVVAELERRSAENPLDERLAVLLLRALAADGRPAEALRTYENLRTRLLEELGVDPSAQLQQLHLELLRGELGAVVEPRVERAGPTPADATRPTNLRAQLTSFVGREQEVQGIAAALRRSRLVTLVGPGGAGKTRLAVEAAAALQAPGSAAADGVWLVELARVTSGADVVQAVLEALGLRDGPVTATREMRAGVPARDAMTRLLDGLGDADVLLVLDNCEHVIEAGAELADHLLARCPHLRVVATSREPLGIVGETLFPVPPLGAPQASASADEASEFAAVRLFADRAAAVRPGFEVDARTVRTVIDIVSRLDGLPLAIELAAARLRSLPLTDVAERLGDRFRLLTNGNRTALPRHRTLRAVVEWSWELLTDDERRLAEDLSVFPAGVTVDSATAISAAPAEDVPDLLASLVDKSLLQPVQDGRRLRMLETIREYGIERLAEQGRLEQVRDKHAVHFAELLAQAEPHLTTAGQLPWFALLGDERENIVAALRHVCERGEADAALRMVVRLATAAMMVGEHSEVAVWAAAALDVPGAVDARLRLVVRCLYTVNSEGFGHEADAVHGTLATLVQELRSTESVSTTPMMAMLRPALAMFAGELELATQWASEAIAGDDEWTRAATKMLVASFAENTGDIEAMHGALEEALADFRRIGERWGLAACLQTLAQLRTLDGDLDAASAACEEALSVLAEIGSSDDEVFLHMRQADLALRRGDAPAARRHAGRARTSVEGTRASLENLFVLAATGELELWLGDLERAHELVQEAMRGLDGGKNPDHPAQGHVHAVVTAAAGRVALARGDLERAGRLARRAHDSAAATKDMQIVSIVAVLIAELAAAAGADADSARLLGASAALRGSEDLTAPAVRSLRERLQARLGAQAFESAYAAGLGLPRDDAAALAVPG